MAPRMPRSTGSWDSRRTELSTRKGRVDSTTSAPSPLMGAEGSARSSCSSACRASCGSGRSCRRSRSSCARRLSHTRISSRRNKASRRLPRSMPQLWQR